MDEVQPLQNCCRPRREELSKGPRTANARHVHRQISSESGLLYNTQAFQDFISGLNSSAPYRLFRAPGRIVCCFIAPFYSTYQAPPPCSPRPHLYFSGLWRPVSYLFISYKDAFNLTIMLLLCAIQVQSILPHAPVKRLLEPTMHQQGDKQDQPG